MSGRPPILMVVTDPGIPDLETRLDSAIAGGATWIQYRDKTASSMDRVLWIARFRERHPQVPLLVNGDIEAAKIAGAFGVHLAENGLTALEAGEALGPDRAIGRSLHWEGFQKGIWREKGLGYALFGTVFRSASHPGGAVAGLGRLKRVCERIAEERPWMPVLAIGGVDAANAGRCRASGAAGVAVVRSVLSAPDPSAAAAGILEAMQEVL